MQETNKLVEYLNIYLHQHGTPNVHNCSVQFQFGPHFGLHCNFSIKVSCNFISLRQIRKLRSCHWQMSSEKGISKRLRVPEMVDIYNEILKYIVYEEDCKAKITFSIGKESAWVQVMLWSNLAKLIAFTRVDHPRYHMASLAQIFNNDLPLPTNWALHAVLHEEYLLTPRNKASEVETSTSNRTVWTMFSFC